MFAAAGRLERAYVCTDYAVGNAVLRIGLDPSATSRVLRTARRAAIVTAANPESRVLLRALNIRRNARLRAALGRFLCSETIARDPIGDWPDERGWLVRGISPAEAASIARRFRQNAIVLLRRGAAPRLRPLR